MRFGVRYIVTVLAAVICICGWTWHCCADTASLSSTEILDAAELELPDEAQQFMDSAGLTADEP